MAKVICTLPNASELINGIKFIKHEAGVISEEISDEAAAAFASIKGYVLDGVKAVEDDLDKLRARATELGVAFKGNWKKERLSSEIARAEENAAEAAAAAAAAAEAAAGSNTNASADAGAHDANPETTA